MRNRTTERLLTHSAAFVFFFFAVYAVSVFIIATGAAIVSLFDAMWNWKSIQKMARIETYVRVLRDGIC